MSKKLPLTVMHEPKPMAWAEATPLSEHKERENSGIEPEIISIGDSKNNPAPISRATTDLRKAYPYIFDCAAYAKTQNPQNIEYDTFYARFEMPYEKFIDYCLDYCIEQRDYLLSEISKLMEGQPAKYIKVSKNKTVYALPVVLAFIRIDLETGKEKRLRNIGQETRVEKVQVQILKELLDYSHGYVNQPKALYAKTRHIYNIMRNNVQLILEKKDNYRDLINEIKSRCNTPVSTQELARFAESIIGQAKYLEKFDPEQGGFYKIYLALEYILANRSRKKRGKTESKDQQTNDKQTQEQKYDFLKLCEKCAPEYVQKGKNGQLWVKNKREAFRFGLMIRAFISLMPETDRLIMGIKQVTMDPDTGDFIAEFLSK